MQALVLIDIQNDYFPGGRMELVGSEAAGIKAGKLLDVFRKKGLPVFHIQHVSTRPTATFFLPGTKGVAIHSSVAPFEGEPIIQKHFPSSFKETDLLELLEKAKITHLVIAGMMTQMCVDTTVRVACDLGFTCQVAHDACATRDLSFEERTVSASDVQIAYMAALNGLFAQVQDADTICVSMLAQDPDK